MDPKQQPHLRAVPQGGGHRVRGIGDPVDAEVVESTPTESATAVGATASPSPLATAGAQVSTALARAVAEPIMHAALMIAVGVAGAGVGALTGKTWNAAGVGAGTNLFLLGLGVSVLGRTLSPQLRIAYLVLSLLGAGGAGYALWAGSGSSSSRRK